MRVKGYIYSIIQLVIFLLSWATEWYAELVFSVTIVTFLLCLDKLGKGIILRELMALHGCVVCLLMPMLGYLIYNESNYLAVKWLHYMPVNEKTYFDFALPAMTGFVTAVCWPVNSPPFTDTGKYLTSIIDKSRNILAKIPNIGLTLLIVGVSVYAISDFLPTSLQFAFLLFYFSSFAGFLYVYFTPNVKYKVPILILFGLFIVFNALKTGMFTIIAYMGITIFSFFFIGRKSPMWKKMIGFVVGIFLLMLIQSVKQTYRKLTWKSDFEGNRAMVFSDLIQERLQSNAGFFSADAFFPMYYRGNQGYNVGLVMQRIPALQPFDNGNNLLTSFASSLVPRVVWPNKPEAGGKFNMKYYTGYVINGWSTNVGPLGEAYGSFGVLGGIIYMTFLGAFVRWSYRKVFVIAHRIPLLLFWIPVLFYQVTYSLESDTLQILNSLFKSALFIWLIHRFLPKWLGVKRRHFERRNVFAPPVEPTQAELR